LIAKYADIIANKKTDNIMLSSTATTTYYRVIITHNRIHNYTHMQTTPKR